jgi:streptomycin 6-kinase
VGAGGLSALRRGRTCRARRLSAIVIAHPLERLRRHAVEWDVAIESTEETQSSIIAYGTRGATHVVLKLVKDEGDEWNSGEVVQAFDGRGVARVHEHTGGALLLERLQPGQSLVALCERGDDEAATDVLASVIERMAPRATPAKCVMLDDFAASFDRYLTANDARVPRAVVVHAQETFAELCRSQNGKRLLHGDLQHSNVLFDNDRGWVAIDPKGVVGELEYELAAFLRNPTEQPQLSTDPRVFDRRVRQLTTALELDLTRVRRWAFAQSVLSAIWDWEDGK